VTPLVIAVALTVGLVGGAIAAVAIGAIQAWIARPKGSGVSQYTRGGAWATRVGPATPGSAGGMGPFDRFNDRAKRVLALAQDEAIRHNHNYIGTEHLLAGLLRDGDTAARALRSLGIELVKVRTALEFMVGRGDQTTSPSEITLSPRTKKVIELAIDEARQMRHGWIGSEHVLLGLIREGEGIASGILESLGVRLPALRARVLELMGESGAPASSSYDAPRPMRAYAHGPFDRFTDRAKRVLALAQDESVRMGHNYIGPEHLLLGLARLHEIGHPDEAMKRIFEALGVTHEQLLTELGKIIPPTGREPEWTVTLSPETKEVLRFAHESVPDKPVVPEDLLLAIVHDEQSFGTQLLARLGVTPERVRAVVGH